MIAPRTEFVLLSASLAFALALLAYVALFAGVDTAQWGRAGWESMKLAPAALIATLLGACAVMAWHARATRNGRRWTAGGLTLRTLLMAFVGFPLVLAAWFTGMTLLEATVPGVDRSFVWVVPSALMFTAFTFVLGAVPAFAFEFFVSRRYLRRVAVTTGSA